MKDLYLNEGDIVKDKETGQEWEVIRYTEKFTGSISMEKTEIVYCRNLQSGTKERFPQDELVFVKSNHPPFIIE